VAQLDVSGMWAAWLAKKLDVPTSAGMLEREGLLAWAARDSRGPAFLSEVPEPRRTEVEDALRRHLASLGPDLAAVFQAWRAGRGADALEAGLLFASLAGRGETAARMFVRRLCKDVLRVTSDELIVRVAPALGAAAPGSLRLLERSEHSVRVRAVLDAADARADDPEVRALLGEDPRLPVGWEARRARLAEALEKGVEAREASDVRGATDALRDLESHRTFQEWQGSRLEPAEMAVRLLAWLAGPGVELEEGAASLTDAEGLGRWYAHEGGFVDWARHRARADGGRPPRARDPGRRRGRGRPAVGARPALRRGTAGAYVQARRASTQMLPLDRVTERLCKRFLDEREDRRLLVLLIDGMGWAQANELLLDLQDQRVQPIAQPIAWNQTKKGRIGDGNTTWNTVLAGLPTVTEVSRSAFFLGAPIAPGEAGVDASRDDERFRRNKAILHYFAGSETPTLFLRGEVSAQGGQVTQEAVQAVKDPRKRVVGVVLNAIDSSLKADPQRGERWDARAIKPLLPLLEAARDAGRAVLFVSDHGHVRADRFEAGVRKPDAGARWRPWRGDDDRLDDWEMKLDGDGVWAPSPLKRREVMRRAARRRRAAQGPRAVRGGPRALREGDRRGAGGARRSAAGAGKFKAVRGEYGTGKTFFARWLEHRARAEGLRHGQRTDLGERDAALPHGDGVPARGRERCRRRSGRGRVPLADRRWFYSLEDEVLAAGAWTANDADAVAEAVG
jgi:hypothetical protein